MPTMTPLPLEFQDLLRSLNDHRVQYLVVGGWAVIHYGYVRHTGDIDIWIAVSPENTNQLAAALMQFCHGRFDADSINKKRKTLELGNPPLRVHIMCDISGVQFADCQKRREAADWDGISVPVISLADLMKNKLATGRIKDHADVEFFVKYVKQPQRKKKP
jgi:hypothetical protein